jgi:hypothetical protein
MLLLKSGIGEKALFALLVCLYLLPLWAFRYVPTADGPSHLANAVIIKDYRDPGATTLREYYVISTRPSPNLLYHLSLVGLTYVFPPLIAEKVLLSLYVVLFAAAFRYLVVAVSRKPGPAALLVFPFIFSFSFNLGFFGWAISLALAALGVGYYWRRRKQLNVKAVVALNAIGIVAALALGEGLWQRARKMKEGAGRRAALGALWSRVVAAAYISPAAAVGLWYVATYPSEYPVTHSSFPELVRNMLRLEWLISFNVWQRAAAYVTATSIGVLVLSVVAYKVYVTLLCRSFKVPGGWTAADAIWGVVFGYAAFYFLCPWGGPAGGSYVSPRLALIPFLAVAVWLSTVPGRIVRRTLFGLAPPLALFSLVGVVLGYVGANRDLEEYNTGVPYVGEGATVLPVHYLYATGKNNKAGYMCNAVSYYVLDNRGVNLLNYEADFDYFPVNWRHGPPVGEPEAESKGTPIYEAETVRSHADYLVCWKVNPFCGGMQAILSGYELVHSTTHLMVFRRRGDRDWGA